MIINNNSVSLNLGGDEDERTGLAKLQKLLGIGKYWSHHWMLHVHSLYWALDHLLSFILSLKLAGWISLSSDMKSCRALTLHFFQV